MNYNSQRLSRLISGAAISAIALTTSQPTIAQVLPEGGQITVRSDVQEANSETGVVTAKGNVQISYPAKQIQATAAQAQYYSRERRLVLSGNVYVLQDGNSMRSETITYLIDEGRFIASPKANRQVESTYIVSEPASADEDESQPQPQLDSEPLF